MLNDGLIGGGAGAATGGPAPDKASLIKDGTDASFMADIVEASRVQPVIVDFWATWCGPCRTLTPTLEKAVMAAKGAVKLVKIDVDKNPRFAGQLRVQSIPTVYGFVDGQPVDGFQGAQPESEVKRFIDGLVKRKGGPAAALEEEIKALLEIAAESLSLNDIGGAAQAYAQVLQLQPDSVKAIAGLARCYLQNGDPERAREILDQVPPEAKDADLDGVRAALALAEQAGDDGELTALEARVAADAGDHAARLELAAALAGRGRMEEAADHLLSSIAADREWNEGAARKQLLTLFDAAGQTSEVTKAGRRRLSAILFS